MVNYGEQSIPHPGIDSAWPLFDTMFKRRSRRLSVGAEIPGGATKFRSENAPAPLDEVEEAFLVWGATGVTGTVLGDLPFRDDENQDAGGNTIMTWRGLTYASPCASHETRLIYWNDEGTYFVKYENVDPTKVLEFETKRDWEKVLRFARASKVKLFDGRPEFPHTRGVMLPFNLWDSDIPGSTMFLPVLDCTYETINTLLLAIGYGTGAAVVDDVGGTNKYAGCEKWVKSGLLDEKRAIPLSSLGTVSVVEIGFMMQNLQLAIQAMGLGGWVHAAPHPLVMMGGTPMAKGLGFRFDTPRYSIPKQAGFGGPIPVGLDGFIEPFMPPYYANMDAAVDAVVDLKFGTKGIYTPGSPPTALRDQEGFMADVPPHTEDVIQCVKDIVNYAWDTYGRFPVGTDPIQTHSWFQAHHLDLDFYDQFYTEGAYTETQREHTEMWHSAAAKGAIESLMTGVAP
jgi:hypothetical protein